MTGIHHCSGITHLSIKDYKHPNKIGKIQEPEHKTIDRGLTNHHGSNTAATGAGRHLH